MEAAFDDLDVEQGRRALRPRQQRRRRLRRRAHARAARRSKRSRLPARQRRRRARATRGPISRSSGRIGLTVVEIANAQEWELHFSEVSECDLIVDAIVGTGFHGPLTGLLETVVADVNGLGVPVVAIDLPTGVSADSHELEGKAIEASMTVTLAAPKLPLVLPPADAYAGDLVIADIGIPASIIDELDGPYLELLTRERMRELAPARAADSHKGDFGRVLVVAGSVGRSGAAHLAALGALRSGAGLVTIATAKSVRANRGRHGAGVHDASRSRKPPRARSTSPLSIACSIFRPTSSRSARASGRIRRRPRSSTRSSSARARRSCSTPTR